MIPSNIFARSPLYSKNIHQNNFAIFQTSKEKAIRVVLMLPSMPKTSLKQLHSSKGFSQILIEKFMAPLK